MIIHYNKLSCIYNNLFLMYNQLVFDCGPLKVSSLIKLHLLLSVGSSRSPWSKRPLWTPRS